MVASGKCEERRLSKGSVEVMQSSFATLVCPVRDCGRPLEEASAGVRCGAGHAFDRARSGYLNLLLAHERRAREPGDSAEVAAARRRGLERGLGAALVDALANQLVAHRGAALLDVGAGEGSLTAALAARTTMVGHGVDISRPGIDAAARRFPALCWIVANADRHLPFARGAFDAVLSITGPKNAAEMARVLAPGGRLFLAVSGPDDQAELREAVLGAAHRIDRAPRMRELFGGFFELEDERDVRTVHRLDRAGLADLFAGSYRGARHRERERLERLETLDVTISYRLMRFRASERRTS